MQRLLVLASTFPADAQDGTPAFVRDLAVVQATEFEVLVLVPSVPGAPREEWIDGVHVVRYRYFPRRWEDLASGAIIENLRARKSRYLQVVPLLLAQWLAIRRLRRSFRPDLLHVHWIIPQGVAGYGLMRRVPSLLTSLGGDLYALNGRLPTALKRAVVARARYVTTVNADMRDRVIALGAPAEKVRVLPMGVHADAFGRSAAGDRRPGRLLFVGRLVEKKGLTHLLAAAAALPSTVNWTLVVAGDGPLRQDMEHQAADMPVEFAGQLGREQLSEHYRRSSIVIAPSVAAASGDQDGLPVALLEAMAAGCAVLASDLPGLNDVIEDGVSGVLVPSGDVPALTAQLQRLLTDDQFRERLAAAAPDAVQDFSMASIGARYNEILRGLSRADRGLTEG